MVWVAKAGFSITKFSPTLGLMRDLSGIAPADTKDIAGPAELDSS